MPKVSIIIPVYNMADYLHECLDSVINQSLSEIEIICINDGSTDESAEIIQEYCNSDKRITLKNQENSGVASARNSGLRYASGEFVCFIDSDDLYPDENVLADLYNTAIENNVKICGGSFSNFVNGADGINTIFEGKDWGYVFNEDRLWYYSDYQFDYGYHRFMYNRKMLIDADIFFPPYIRFQDPPFFVRAMIESKQFYALKRITYQYRIAHKGIDWHAEKVASVLRGVLDNLIISKENDLYDLHTLTLRRIETIDIHIINALKGENASVIIDILKKMDEYTAAGMLKRSRFWTESIKTARHYLKEVYPAPQERNRLFFINSKKTSPLISVIIPVYNAKDFLAVSLDGVVNQTYQNLEIICIDDGSTDNSYTILKDYADRDDRMRILRQNNNGVALARNAGLEIASGSYISFLDSDDIFEKTLYCEMLPKAVKTKADICVCQSDSFSDDVSDRLPNSFAFNESLMPRKKVFSLQDVPQHSFNVFHGFLWDKLFNIDFIKQNGFVFYNTKAASDARFVHMALASSRRIATVPKVLIHRRRDRVGAITGHRDYQSFFVSYTGLRTDLQNAGIWERFEQSWVNRVLHTGLWYLKSNDGTINKEFYYLLKTAWLDELGLSDKDASWFLSQDDYTCLQKIKTLSYDEFAAAV